MSRIQHVVVVMRQCRVKDDVHEVREFKCGAIDVDNAEEARQVVDEISNQIFRGEHFVRVSHYKGSVLLPFDCLKDLARDIDEAI